MTIAELFLGYNPLKIGPRCFNYEKEYSFNQGHQVKTKDKSNYSDLSDQSVAILFFTGRNDFG